MNAEVLAFVLYFVLMLAIGVVFFLMGFAVGFAAISLTINDAIKRRRLLEDELQD